MKKILSTIFTIIIFAGTVSAQTISAERLKNDIQKIVTEDYKTKTSAELDIKVTMLPFPSINLPDGRIDYVILNNDDYKLTSRAVKRINILIDGKLQRTISVPLEIKAYQEVPIAIDTIEREQPITLSKVRFKKINIADKSDFVVSRESLNKEIIAKKEFKEGEFIDKRFVKERPDVTMNSEVRIILNSDNGFQIAIDGIAKKDGVIGEYVTVENKMYNKVYNAKVIGENRVLVNI